MKCPKCKCDMYSKYRDGGSVLICYACSNNFGHDFEMKNPDYSFKGKPTLSEILKKECQPILDDVDLKWLVTVAAGEATQSLFPTMAKRIINTLNKLAGLT